MKKLFTVLLLIISLTASAQLFQEDATHLRFHKVKVYIKAAKQVVKNEKVFIVKYDKQQLEALTGKQYKTLEFKGKAKRKTLKGQLFWKLQTQSGTIVYIHADKKIVMFEDGKSITMLYN